jgi:TetR/AcrR family transcriptional repressor of nem operon
MSKAEKTKAFIIEKSSRIFNTKGYSGTSLNDITEATGLTKGAIYGNFEDKNDIAIAVYKYNVGGFRKRVAELIDAQKMGYDKLFAITTYYRTNWQRVFERGGCPMLNASIEADDNMPFLKKTVQTTLNAWVDHVASIIDLGKKQNQINKNIDSREYATTIITLIEGGLMMGKIHNDHKLLFNALNRIELIINRELKK